MISVLYVLIVDDKYIQMICNVIAGAWGKKS